MGLFGKSGSPDLEFDIVDPGGGASEKRCVDERFENGPNLRPALAHGFSQAPGMFPAKDRAIGVVVKADILGPPPQKMGKPAGKDQPHGVLKRGRPIVRRTNRRLAPIQAADEAAHFAAASKPAAVIAALLRY